MAKYFNFVDIFLKKFTIELFQYLSINKNSIKLNLDKKLLYKLIYSIKPMKLEPLKTYIKIN